MPSERQSFHPLIQQTEKYDTKRSGSSQSVFSPETPIFGLGLAAVVPPIEANGERNERLGPGRPLEKRKSERA